MPQYLLEERKATRHEWMHGEERNAWRICQWRKVLLSLNKSSREWLLPTLFLRRSVRASSRSKQTRSCHASSAQWSRWRTSSTCSHVSDVNRRIWPALSTAKTLQQKHNSHVPTKLGYRSAIELLRVFSVRISWARIRFMGNWWGRSKRLQCTVIVFCGSLGMVFVTLCRTSPLQHLHLHFCRSRAMLRSLHRLPSSHWPDSANLMRSSNRTATGTSMQNT